LGGPGGSFGPPTGYLVGDPGTRTSLEMISADFNGDGDPDLLAAPPNRVVVLVGGAGGTFTETARFEGTGPPFTTGDFNGDGDPDLATTDPAFPGPTLVRLGLPGSGFGAPTPYVDDLFPSTLFGIDVDQDGDDDLVKFAPTFNEIEPAALFVRPGDPNGQLGDASSTPIPQIATSPLFADFNRDGDPDLAFLASFAIGDPPDVQATILAGAAGTTFATGPSAFVGLGSSGPLVTGDFNGDRKTDLALLATLVAFEPGDIGGPVLGIWLNTTAVDKTKPKIHIRVPRNGAKYVLGARVLADYDCVDPESQVTTCAGPVPDGQPIDTSSVGHKTFRVTAVSAGGSARRTHHYRVIHPPR
jgi:FG-GAP-like repeat